MRKISVWRLGANSSKRRTSLWSYEDESEEFSKIEGYLRKGKKIKSSWTPPEVEVEDGKNRKLCDFVLHPWAPVISEKAKDLLMPLISPYVEVFYLMEIRGNPYYMVNVHFKADCLDYENCVTVTGKPMAKGKNLYILEYAFDSHKVPDVPIFRVIDGPGYIFVRSSFVECVIQNKLTGAQFHDPGVSPFATIASGKSGNVVPGVLE